MLCENVLINGADKYQKFAMWGNYLMRVAACKVTTVRTNQLVCVQLSEPFVLCLFKSSPPSHARRKRKLHSLMQLTGTMEMRQTDAAPTICCSFFILEPQLPAFFFLFQQRGEESWFSHKYVIKSIQSPTNSACGSHNSLDTQPHFEAEKTHKSASKHLKSNFSLLATSYLLLLFCPTAFNELKRQRFAQLSSLTLALLSCGFLAQLLL